VKFPRETINGVSENASGYEWFYKAGGNYISKDLESRKYVGYHVERRELGICL
jgi:hypothetical protein